MTTTHSVAVTRDGIQIEGRPFTLLGGQLHYFRFPRAEWRDQLLRARAGGVNTIDTVIPWNWHAPTDSSFDFDGDADLAHYLDLCHELRLRAIVRPGPYICAEWENGGFPAWLTALPDLELRVDNPLFLEHTLRWFDALMPILAERQITHGGPIILCQIENEHWASGRYGHDDHQRTLAQAAIERGIDVPQYTCMGPMTEWAEFRNGWSGIAEKLVQTRAAWPDNPLIVSELWSGWFDNWGASRHNTKAPAKLDQTLYQLLAVGASGWSHWMWSGGTNFGFWGGRTVGGDTVHMTTSYDYDAPVSEYGGLTEKFFVARRHHLFMSTLGAPLAQVLAGAVPGGPQVIAPAAVAGRGVAGGAPYRNVRAGAGAPAGWADFTATFLHNPDLDGQTHQLFLKSPAAHLAIEVEATSIKPIFSNLPLGIDAGGWRREVSELHRASSLQFPASLVLEFHTSRILGFWQHAEGDTLVLYGRDGEVGELQLGTEGTEFTVEGDIPSNAELTIQHAKLHLRYWIADRPTVIRAHTECPLVIVLLTQARAERWWPVADGFVCGPHLVLEADRQAAPDARDLLPLYSVDRRGVLATLPVAATPRRGPSIAWGAGAAEPLRWTRRAVAECSAADGWQRIERPIALERLGCDLGYGWYRAEFDLEEPSQTTLVMPWLNDRARVLVDGADAGWLGVHPHGPRFTLPLQLGAGRHDLRLLVDNLGRFNYGSNTGEHKGLLDTLYFGGAQHDLTGGWVALWQEAMFAGEAIANAKPGFVRPDAADVRLDAFAFQGPSVWLLREVEIRPNRHYVLHITGDRNSGALFVNGVAATRFSRHYGGGYIRMDITAMLHPGANVLALNIQGYAGAPWRAILLEYDPAHALDARWSFRPELEIGGASGEAINSGMAWFRATFAYDAATHGDGPFRLHLPGLHKGQIWLNGHNVGRFWQSVGPQESYKLPASWLGSTNELLIFEEHGAAPELVWIEQHFR